MIDVNEMIIILYVKDQNRSREFYVKLFGINPTLDVEGMTEIPINKTARLGLMPGDGIVKILDGKVENPNLNLSTPRCEIYLYVDNPDHYFEKAKELGGTGISAGSKRNWGDYVSYCADFDGNIIAFAKKNSSEG